VKGGGGLRWSMRMADTCVRVRMRVCVCVSVRGGVLAQGHVHDRHLCAWPCACVKEGGGACTGTCA